MSGKYVPPSKRPGYVPTTTSAPPPGPTQRQYINPRSRDPNKPTYTHSSIRDIFRHPQTSTINTFAFDEPEGRHRGHYTIYKRDPDSDDAPDPVTIPLPPSPPPPPMPHPLSHIVSYTMIFAYAHPAWESHRELWMHTGAEELLADFQGEKKNFLRPIPVFQAVRRNSGQVDFAGWWVIDDILEVEPQSEMLTEMLQIKEQAKSYSKNGRVPSAWAASLSQQWLKVHLSPAPPSSEHYTELREPATLEKGEGEKYILMLGGLKHELEILELANAEKQLEMEREVQEARARRIERAKALGITTTV